MLGKFIKMYITVFVSLYYRQKPESDLTIPCLGLLANLCRHNLPIQAHVKALVNTSQLYYTV